MMRISTSTTNTSTYITCKWPLSTMQHGRCCMHNNQSPTKQLVELKDYF